VFQDTIEGVKNDPYGPKIDIRNDLVSHLGQRATLITDFELPITPTSQRTLLAIEVKNIEALAASLEKSMHGDPKARPHKIGEFDVWEILNEEDATTAPSIEDPGDADDDDDDNTAEATPDNMGKATSAVTVALGHLFIASHIDMLQKVLLQPVAASPLEFDSDYRLVVAEYEKLGAGETCARGFVRSDEQYHATYQLFREGKLPEADTFFAKLLNLVLGEDKEGVTRKPRLDGEKLPDFETVRRYFGVAGSFATSEPTGWLIVGFTVGKPIPLVNSATTNETTTK
jgi:hypothetical protein